MRSNVCPIKLSVKRADTLPIYTSLLYSPLPFVDRFGHHLQLPLPLHFTYATFLDLVTFYLLLAFLLFRLPPSFSAPSLSQVLVVRLALSSLVISVTLSNLRFAACWRDRESAKLISHFFAFEFICRIRSSFPLSDLGATNLQGPFACSESTACSLLAK